MLTYAVTFILVYDNDPYDPVVDTYYVTSPSPSKTTNIPKYHGNIVAQATREMLLSVAGEMSCLKHFAISTIHCPEDKSL